jgi:hypothetical protein
MTKAPTSIRLSPEVRDAIEKASIEEGRSVSNMIERIVRAWLQQREILPRG